MAVRISGDVRLSLAVAAAAAALSVAAQLYAPGHWDIDQLLFSGRALVHGRDPYALVGQTFWPYPLYYPLTAVLVVLPLSVLPYAVARALFAALSAGLLTAGILRTGRYRLLILLSWPVIRSIVLGQWGPLLCAAFLLPGLSWLWVAKPNFALPFLLARPDRRTILPLVVGGGALLAISLVVLPGWPAEWLRVVRHPVNIRAPILAPIGGPLLALALLRWRDPDARLLFGLACVPQTSWPYNLVPALLVARTMHEAWQLTALSWVATFVQALAIIFLQRSGSDYEPSVGAVVLLFYLPAILIVLRRKQVPAPASGHDTASAEA